MNLPLLAVFVVALGALVFASNAQAVVNQLSSEGRVYLSCVARKVDTDVALRGHLLTAVARQKLRASGKGYSDATDADERAWIKIFNQRIAPACGPIPKYPVILDVIPPMTDIDHRPDAERAAGLLSAWSNRIGRNARGQLVWRKK
jgi:hypothetical protein